MRLILAVLTLWPGFALADPLISLTSGIFCNTRPTTTSRAPDTLQKSIEILDRPLLVQETTRIPDIDGVLFGVEELLRPEDRRALIITVEHPPFHGVTVESWTSVPDATAPTFHGYELGNLGGSPRGHWRITGSRGREILFQAEFEVVAPTADMRRDAAACSATS
ncbi:DUF3859 domain-containing protein [Stagnihabitans tardus]|uniref:DUF3859 domain-containing protein n=1 Tax=Stagnihabitans tardus TaxID=2699202 RepID=A0AAE4YD75_9RHOB|nr:DUF3859 domain-containing protein [Stagnihabitans tardus]NBZ87405.1 DUF3859 domain-containing protein [Stagnihabitans tardus]